MAQHKALQNAACRVTLCKFDLHSEGFFKKKNFFFFGELLVRIVWLCVFVIHCIMLVKRGLHVCSKPCLC